MAPWKRSPLPTRKIVTAVLMLDRALRAEKRLTLAIGKTITLDMDKQTQLRMINLTLSALSEASLQAPTAATLQALSFWQAALNRVAGR